MNKYILTLLSAVLLAACCSPSLEGEWTQPVPALPGQQQGMRLEADGTASSINMHTLLYESWKRHEGRLILTGKSIGNGQTLIFTESYRIKTLTKDRLELEGSGGEILRFKRVK